MSPLNVGNSNKFKTYHLQGFCSAPGWSPGTWAAVSSFLRRSTTSLESSKHLIRNNKRSEICRIYQNSFKKLPGLSSSKLSSLIVPSSESAFPQTHDFFNFRQNWLFSIRFITITLKWIRFSALRKTLISNYRSSCFLLFSFQGRLIILWICFIYSQMSWDLRNFSWNLWQKRKGFVQITGVEAICTSAEG